MSYVSRVLSKVTRRARARYRFYLYWRAEEKRVRKYSLDQLRARQWEKFTALLRFAYDRIPHYRDKFKEAGITPESIRSREDLVRIPVLTKDEIRRNFPDRLLDGQRAYDTDLLGQTSGSTAESLHFVRPQETWNRSLYYSVLLRMGGVRNIPILVLATPRCTAATCSLQEGEEDLAGTWISRLHKSWFLRHLDDLIGLPSSENVLGASAEYMERLLNILNIYAPCLLVVDPVYLGALARYLKGTGHAVPRITGIVTTYELLTGSLKDLLQEVFRCDIYTQYGCSEVPDVANECEYHRLHVRSQTVLVEAIRGGRPAEPGEPARCILTDLGNYNMPFIRYDVGDIIVRGDGACACGRNTETIEAVHGRVVDVVQADVGNGDRLLTPLQVDDIFRGVRGVAWYRLVQQGDRQYRLDIMPDGVEGGLDREGLLQRCRSTLGEKSEIHIDLVDEIKPEASMKYRFVYSQSAIPTL